MEVAETRPPSELWMYERAERERRHDMAVLVAWAARLVALSTPRSSKGADWRSGIRTLDGLLARMPPPGYDERIEKERRGKAMRAELAGGRRRRGS